jgi:N-sulfoglucosamine sulfohydrolase
MKAIRCVALLLLLVWLVIPPVSGQQQKSKRPNILWIVAEDMSPRLSCYGEKAITTPNLDQLAIEGIRYTHAFTTAGVCAPSRSAIITGMYQTSIGTQHMRTLIPLAEEKNYPIPRYSAVLPEQVKCFTEYLRSAGYYCTNNEKQDYQFEPPVTAWDESSIAASWRNRAEGQPFFSVFNIYKTHESQLFPSNEPLTVDPSSVTLPPIYPDIPTARSDMARFLSNVKLVDQYAGEIIAALKKDNLYEQTIIFFFGDHGDALPWMKRELYERGIKIPLIIRVPGSKESIRVNDELISSIDFAPTVLSLAGVRIPDHLQGQAFLGSQKSTTPRQYIFAARDRMDTEYDRVRIVRDKKYKYVFNYMPEKPNYQNIAYRLRIPMMNDFLRLRDEGKLTATQMNWFATKAQEELYNVERDPFELNNLAGDEAFRDKLTEMRQVFTKWTKDTNDLGGIPEKEMIANWWNGKNEAPTVAEIKLEKTNNGYRLSCETSGASVAFRILNRETKKVNHEIMTWDFARQNPKIKNGDRIPSKPSWQPYTGLITLTAGDTLMVKGYRAGFKESVLTYVAD